MIVKAGVKLDKLQPQMTLALMAVERVWTAAGREPVLTSGNDGVHREGSLHYVGLALDFRSRNLSSNERYLFREQLEDMLGDEFDVVLEFNPHHYHIEWDIS